MIEPTLTIDHKELANYFPDLKSSLNGLLKSKMPFPSALDDSGITEFKSATVSYDKRNTIQC